MKKYIYLLFLILFLTPQYVSSEESSILRVHFIDVGQGDSMLIETPENQIILIDAGEPDQGEQVVNYLQDQGITEIDLMIATHPDFDHIGGLIEVIRNFPIHRLLENGEPHSTKTYARYRLLLLKENVPIQIAKENEKIIVEEDIELHIIYAASSPAEYANESSIALKLTYDTVDFLFMSDIEAEQEKEIIAKHEIDAEILKVAHHGSNSSSTMKFLEEANPEVAIISYSEANEYGHPVKRVIRNLMMLESQIFSTAVYGNIIVETDGNNYIVMPQLQPGERLLKYLMKKR